MTTFALPTTREEQVSQLLGCTIEQLDITEADGQAAQDRYQDVAAYLAAEGANVYVQGSFMLGTVVRPHNRRGEFDLDLVCRNEIAKTSITQAILKARVGGQLDDYVSNSAGVDGEVPDLDESRRCWTLGWPRFHMDVLPAIPDPDVPSMTAILLTDKQLREWQKSDPLAYVLWFRSRCAQQFLEQRKAMAKSAGSVAEVPEWRVRTTLHRVAQVLKRHRDLHFAQLPADLRPPSSLITTLAGLSYDGERDLLGATLSVVQRMPEHVEVRDQKLWVPNPVAEENFADKWNEYPERLTAFNAWRGQVERDLEAALIGHGTHALHEQLSKSFGAEPVRKAAAVTGERTRFEKKSGSGLRVTSAGLLTTGAGREVKPNRFFGGPPAA